MRIIDKFTDEELIEMVAHSTTFKEVAIKIGYSKNGAGSGALAKMLQKIFDEKDIDYSHFVGKGWAKKEYTTTNAIRTQYLRTHPYKCEICGISDWLGADLILQLHHIDGNRENNKEENLALLCPNCHTQTENWAGKKHKLRPLSPQMKCKVSDEDFLEAINKYGNIRQACLELNISPGGQNYKRARRLLEENQRS